MHLGKVEISLKYLKFFSQYHVRFTNTKHRGESDNALSYIQLMVNAVEKPKYVSARIGRFYLDLGMLEEAAYWLEKAYANRETELLYPFRPSGSTLPENLPDHPALQAALDKPELNALFEIRRKV